MSTPHPELVSLVEVWREALSDLTDLFAQVPDDAWHTPTDLPGWDVHDVLAHVAHLEHLLAGGAHDDVEVVDAPHAVGMMGQFTEQGVIARRDRSPADLLAELDRDARTRYDELRAAPPTDPDAPAPGLFGAIGWSTRTLLRNRPLDVWIHEQDVRRALGLPGGTGSAAAAHTVDYLLESFGFVVGKKVGAPAGQPVRITVAGHAPVTVAVGDDGRAHPSTDEPVAGLEMDRATFAVAAGGRGSDVADAVTITGDTALGARVLTAMGVTP